MHLNTETTPSGIVCTFPRASNIDIPDVLKEKPAGALYCNISQPVPTWTAVPEFGPLPRAEFASREAAEFYILAAATEYLCQRASSY